MMTINGYPMAALINNQNDASTELLPKTVEEILQHLDALPTTDSRTPDEILGYDEDGLPA